MYVRCDESSLYSRINYHPTAWRGTSLRECQGIIKTMHTGFSAYTYCTLCQRPGADTEETGRYDLAMEKICVVFWMLSVSSNELSKV